MPSQTFEAVKYSSLDYSGGINKSLAAWQTCANQPLDKKVPKKYATSHNEMKKGEEKKNILCQNVLGEQQLCTRTAH